MRALCYLQATNKNTYKDAFLISFGGEVAEMSFFHKRRIREYNKDQPSNTIPMNKAEQQHQRPGDAILEVREVSL